ncbi:ty3-gypsy retrotransposon protein [Cucumis melo var. makuwa]|uniref:Ty3-gypsy retrotransposon protein n=1 Tax=Cucumis melo var. makuwa TaxID=1194695 RepID=A0A5D3C600_CUCMM|nr:ty3-gypsy retrotransposon protein [Cucumis melo var. makuwa]
MHAMLTAMYEDHQRQLGGSKLTGVSTGKRKVRTEEVVEEEADEAETSMSIETGAGQDRIKFKKLEMPVFNGEDLNGGSRREQPFQRWTDSKLQARRDKGLCYRCDEPFSKAHRCKNKELRLCVVSDNLDDAEMEDIMNKGGMVEVSPVVELSLNSVVGLTAPGTFKVKGMVEDREIMIMIDCGATHNFISLKLVEELNIPIAETTNYGLIMGSEKAVQGRGMCKGSQWGFRC